MAKKKKERDVEREVLLNFDPQTLRQAFQETNKQVTKEWNKHMKLLNSQLRLLKRTFTRYEEPYCEVSQSYKAMHVRIRLPNVKKKNIKLHLYPTRLELRAESIVKEQKKKEFKVFHRNIDLPEKSLVKKAKAEFKKDTLQIKIPFKKA